MRYEVDPVELLGNFDKAPEKALVAAILDRAVKDWKGLTIWPDNKTFYELHTFFWNPEPEHDWFTKYCEALSDAPVDLASRIRGYCERSLETYTQMFESGVKREVVLKSNLTGRVCNICLEHKPAEDFYITRKAGVITYFGLSSNCKACSCKKRNPRFKTQKILLAS